jgi:hypothetical protein
MASNIEPSYRQQWVFTDNALWNFIFVICKVISADPDNCLKRLAVTRRWVQHYVQCYNCEHRNSGEHAFIVAWR